MHMEFWWGYDLGGFLFDFWNVETRTAFALTAIFCFFFAFLLEGSKIYVARTQRQVKRRLIPSRESESGRHPTCSRASSRAGSSRVVYEPVPIQKRCLLNGYNTMIYTIHSTLSYLLMLAVMYYNVYIMAVVILGFMAGHLVFGTQLIRLQMECSATKTLEAACSNQCDDDAETSTPPLPTTSETEYLICQTRSCAQPSHYHPCFSNQDGGPIGCQYGAKACPSRLANVKSLKARAMLQAQTEGCCSIKEKTEENDPILIIEKSSTSCCKSKNILAVENETEQIESQPSSTSKSCCKAKIKNDVS